MSSRAPADAALVSPAAGVAGRVRVPGDKSISHRYALLAALADGDSLISGYSTGADCAATLGCLRGLGVTIDATVPGRIVPSVQMISPRGLRLAWGEVPSSRVPLGTMSWISTSEAAIWPVLRTVTWKLAGLPTWISFGATFSIVNWGL